MRDLNLIVRFGLELQNDSMHCLKCKKEIKQKNTSYNMTCEAGCILKPVSIQQQLEHIYFLTQNNQITFDEFVLLTKSFWRGINGLG